MAGLEELKKSVWVLHREVRGSGEKGGRKAEVGAVPPHKALKAASRRVGFNGLGFGGSLGQPPSKPL